MTPRRLALMAITLLALAACGDPGYPYFPLAEGRWWQYDIRIRTMDGERSHKLILANAGPIGIDGKPAYRRRTPDGYTLYYRPVADGILRLADTAEQDDRQPPTAARRGNERRNPGVRSLRKARPITTDHYVLREPLEPGTSWTMETETAVLEMSGPPFDTMYELDTLVSMNYRIVATDESVRVPAGVFHDCLKVEGRGQTRIDVGGHLGKTHITVSTTDWYAPGVGLVRSERIEKTDSKVLTEGTYLLQLERYE